MQKKILLTFITFAAFFFCNSLKAQTGEYITVSTDENWISFRTEHTITTLQVKYANETTLRTINKASNSSGNYSTFQISNLSAVNMPVTFYGVQDTLMDFAHNITSIDLSNNPSLEFLGVNGQQLTELDVTNNPNLKTLVASYNKITTLDISQNPLLETVSAHDNQLTSLITSPDENHTLKALDIHNNQLTTMDLTGYKDLVL